jgi:hypothetical protein
MAGFWDWLTVPPSDQQYYQPGNYRLPQIDMGMTGGPPAMPPGGMPAPMNPNLMAGGAPSPMMTQVDPTMGAGGAIGQILKNPAAVAAKAAAAGIRPPNPEQKPGGSGGMPAIDWTATLGDGTTTGASPAGAKDGANKLFGSGLKALQPQESVSAPRPSGSANASVGPADLSFSGDNSQVLQSILALLSPQQTAPTMRSMGIR